MLQSRAPEVLDHPLRVIDVNLGLSVNLGLAASRSI